MLDERVRERVEALADRMFDGPSFNELALLVAFALDCEREAIAEALLDDMVEMRAIDFVRRRIGREKA